MDQEASVREKFRVLAPVMNERTTRLWAAAEAQALGHGGIALVERATGIRAKRIRDGMHDLDELANNPPVEAPTNQRIRRPGRGVKD